METSWMIESPIAADPPLMPRHDRDLVRLDSVFLITEVLEVLPFELTPLAIEPCFAKIHVRQRGKRSAKHRAVDEIIAPLVLVHCVKIFFRLTIFFQLDARPLDVIPRERLNKLPALAILFAATNLIRKDALEIIQAFRRDACLR